jgi:hypothetical protein
VSAVLIAATFLLSILELRRVRRAS